MSFEHAILEATRLADDGRPPSPVVATVRFLSDHQVWFQLTRNPVVRSCREAAHHRRRLGTIGIPLFDELKSFLAVYHDNSGVRRTALLHCRADQELNFNKVAVALGATGPIDRLSEEDAQEFGVQYGTVHPFRALDPRTEEPLRQIFDPAVLVRGDPPYTMMTNAGALNWGIEFRPEQLISALADEGGAVSDITETRSKVPAAPVPAIGIVTGNGPDSGMTLWTLLNAEIRERLGNRFHGDLSYPPVYVRSLPVMGLSMELDHRSEHVWELLSVEIEDLCRDGARVLALACNTTQFFGPRISAIAARYDATFVSMSDATIHHLRAIGADEVAMIGIRYVAELGEWSAYRELSQLRVETVAPEVLERIHKLAYRVKREGASNGARQQLGDILRQNIRSRFVVVALTELSLLLSTQASSSRSEKILVDTLGLYAGAVADAWLARLARR